MAASTTVNSDLSVMILGGNLLLHPQKKVIYRATRQLIDHLLGERISRAGIARAVQVFEQWLLSRSQ